MLTGKEFSALLKRYLEGKCSSQERKAVDRFYDSLREEMSISQEELDRRSDEIWLTLQQRTQRKKSISVSLLPPYFTSGIAASLLLVMAFLLFTGKISMTAEEKLQVQVINGESVINNNFLKERKIILFDGSEVILQPQSRLIVKKFASTRRVELEGEAFFNIAHDVKHPFLVYAQGIETKVLGTSFNVKAYSSDNMVVVKVKTGKVLASHKMKTGKTKEYQITPNREMLYFKKANKLYVQLQENPQLVLTPSELLKMNFDVASVTEVFEALEKAYNLEIIFDRKNFKNCQITTRLSNEGFYDRLNIICKLLDVEYETIETKIYIRGQCK